MSNETVDAVIADMFAEDMGDPAAAEETPIDSPESGAEAEAPQAPAPDPEDSVVEIPPDIKELLEEPDFEAETEAELAAEQAVEEEDENYEFEDDAVAKERKARIAAEKKAQWLEAQRLKDKRPDWKKEALKYFPHSKPFIDKIVNEATSRRAVLRQANAYHEQIAAHVGSIAPAVPQDETALRAAIRAEMEAAWGKPLTGPNATQVPTEALDQAQRWEQARSRGDQVGMLKARLGGREGIKKLLDL